MYVCVYVCMCVYVCVCVSGCVCMCVCVCVYVVFMYVCMCMCMCMCMSVRMCGQYGTKTVLARYLPALNRSEIVRTYVCRYVFTYLRICFKCLCQSV